MDCHISLMSSGPLVLAGCHVAAMLWSCFRLLTSATVSITLNATGVVVGDVVSDVDAGTGGASMTPANQSSAMVIGVPAIAAALGVDEGSVSGLVATPDGPGLLTLTFSLARPSVSTVNASSSQPRPLGTVSSTATPTATSAVVNISGSHSPEAVGTASPTPSGVPTLATVVATPASDSGPNGLSDEVIVGRLVLSLRPWASQVTVQRAAGTAPDFYSVFGDLRCPQACR